jgi:beta-lactamase class A
MEIRSYFRQALIKDSFSASVCASWTRPDIEEKLVTHQLELDRNVWSPGSLVFNPPDLTGLVSERTAMEAMIVHSDNTATDMILREATAKAVRRFIASIGAKNTLIPDSTRALAGYLLGAPDYKTITWEELIALNVSFAHPLLNDVQTLASSANDLVSFYAQALPGRFPGSTNATAIQTDFIAGRHYRPGSVPHRDQCVWKSRLHRFSR